MSREGDKKNNRVQSIRKESLPLPEPDIKHEVNRVGKKVFVISSIAPAIFTIWYLIFYFPDDIKRTIYDPGFEIINPMGLFFTMTFWAVVIFALTMPAMIGKKILFTESKKRILIIMPVITFVICVILGVILSFLLSPMGNLLVSQILIPTLIITAISAIIALKLYYKHISESETYEKGETDKNI